MANILLGVTGSVAATRVPQLYAQLTGKGHAVKVLATEKARYFFDVTSIAPLRGNPPRRNPEAMLLDEDEWSGMAEGRSYQRDDSVLHIELRRWADLLLIAPLDANTLAKLANGLADNCLTCVCRAWDQSRPVVLAPAMNTFMWDHPMTRRHLARVALDCGLGAEPTGELGELIDSVNRSSARLRIVAPASRRLACGDTGVGAMAAVEDIARVAEELLAVNSR